MQWPLAPEIQNTLLYVVALPALTAVVAGILFRLLAGQRASGVGSALALAVGFAAANQQNHVVDWLPGSSALDWIPWVSLAALAAGTVGGESRPRTAPWLVAVVFSMLWLIVPPEVRTESWWSVPLLALVVAGIWAVADEQAQRNPGAIVPVWLALVFLAAAVVLIHAHSKRYMDTAGILAASLLGVGLASFWRLGETGPVTGGAVVFLAGLMLSGQTQTFSQVPWISFVLVGLAPLALGVGFLPFLARWNSFPRLLTQTLVLLAPLIAAVVLAIQNEQLDFSF